ncbi:ATP-dependent DNA helicase PIF1 [Paramuricea clavata]|uniref:ATP-dependent DNA helicase PIF1 n=1 Tax=Paramuricea clavata TaxID=317549 RepID=A0A7D9HTX6_PARCT|nr:ATP-dependent DNA helicase PIF1 [Paramuricea clavata]
MSYQCDVCKELEAREATGIGYICCVCDAEFEIATELEYHMRMHNNVLPHEENRLAKQREKRQQESVAERETRLKQQRETKRLKRQNETVEQRKQRLAKAQLVNYKANKSRCSGKNKPCPPSGSQKHHSNDNSNVRPNKVMQATACLVNTSELYREQGITFDQHWLSYFDVTTPNSDNENTKVDQTNLTSSEDEWSEDEAEIPAGVIDSMLTPTDFVDDTERQHIYTVLHLVKLGPASLFCSFSSAETKWKHLLRILGKLVDHKDYSDEQLDNLNWDEKCRLIQSDPVTCARHFDYQFNTFLKNFLMSEIAPLGNLKDWFYKVEYQQRGSPHIYIVIWLENAPVFGVDKDEDVVNFIDQIITCRKPDNDTEL